VRRGEKEDEEERKARRWEVENYIEGEKTESRR
jgi:hypothetical protein